ncbi:unnamed protein product [Jaminaea pallidilutea]
MDMASSSTMSASTMTAEQARQKALELAQSRKQIDAELNEHAQVLQREGVSLTSPLVDGQGFPLNTVDIPTVRESRAKIHALQNDRKEIDQELNKLLEVALAR